MISVLIYEDNKDLRRSLEMLLKTDKHFKLEGAFENCLNVVEQIQIYNPSIVLMDIDMPGISGIEGVKRIKKIAPQMSILMFTVFDDNERVFSAIEAGASGYLLKKTAPEKILEALHELTQGGAPMSSSIAMKVLQSFQQKRKSAGDQYQLTDKEKEILQSLVAGNSYKVIASQKSISVFTVRNHISNIYSKLHVASATEAVRKALNEGIV